MKIQSTGRAPGRFFSNSIAAVSAIIAAGPLSLVLPESAESQINGRVVSPPKVGSETHPAAQVKEVKRPVQADIPAPPPMIYVPGLSEPFIATGPVSDEETKELNAARRSSRIFRLR